MNAFKFELKREFKQKKNIVIFILISLYLGGLFFYMGFREKDYNREIYKSAMERRVIYSVDKNEYGEEMAKIRKDKNYKITDKNLDSEEDLELLRKADLFKSISAKSIVKEHYYAQNNYALPLTNKERKRVLAAEVNIRREILEAYKDGLVDDRWIEIKNIDLKELAKEANYLEYLDKSDIETIEINPYVKNLKNYLLMFFNPINMFVLLGLILMISIESFIEEFENGSFKSIYSSEYSRSSILNAKYLSKSIINIGLIVLPLIIVSLLISLRYGTGELIYPERAGAGLHEFKLLFKNQKDIYIAVGEKLLVQSLAFILLIIFQTVVSIGLTVITNDRNASFATIVLFMVVAYVGLIFDRFTNAIRYFNPWIYMDINNIFNSRYNTGFYYGILLQVISILITIFVAKKLFKKRDLV